MSTLGELGKKSVVGSNRNVFLGQTDKQNPLLELAQGIMGNAATAQGRGDMLFGGGGGVPKIQNGKVVWGGFKTPGTYTTPADIVRDPAPHEEHTPIGVGAGGGNPGGIVKGGTPVTNPNPRTTAPTGGGGAAPPAGGAAPPSGAAPGVPTRRVVTR